MLEKEIENGRGEEERRRGGEEERRRGGEQEESPISLSLSMDSFRERES
jgi:hypothetical protein